MVIVKEMVLFYIICWLAAAVAAENASQNQNQ
jgi:hypothetical protein